MIAPFIVLTVGFAVLVAILAPKSRYLWSLTVSFGGAFTALHLIYEYSGGVDTVPVAVGIGIASTVSVLGSLCAIVPHLARGSGRPYTGFARLSRRTRTSVTLVAALPGLIVALPWLSMGCLRLLSSVTMGNSEAIVGMSHPVYLTTSILVVVLATARVQVPAQIEEYQEQAASATDA